MGDDACRNVVLSGDLDISTTDQLRAALHQPAVLGPRLVVIDMAAVSFVAVAGLTALMDAQTAYAVGGTRMRLRHISRSTRRILQLTGLDNAFDIEDVDVIAEKLGPAA